MNKFEYKLKQPEPGLLSKLNTFMFEYMLPAINTPQFYLVLGLYVFILCLVIHFLIEKFNDFMRSMDVDEETQHKASLIEDRKVRQKEAEAILSKYFTVKSTTEDEIMKNPEVLLNPDSEDKKENTENLGGKLKTD